MKFLILTDIEGVSGITTYEQAEGSQYGKDMLMHDLFCVIDVINKECNHDILIYDEHMDGRNVDLTRVPPNVSVFIGKPLETEVWKTESHIDGLIMVGFHGMAGTPKALLPHSYYREHRKIFIDDLLVGEIGMEAALAGVYGTPLILVTGDSHAEAEARTLNTDVETAVVKIGYGENEALCYGTLLTEQRIKNAARKALEKLKAGVFTPMKTNSPVTLTVEVEASEYLEQLKKYGSSLFINDNTLSVQESDISKAWEKLLQLQKEAL